MYGEDIYLGHRWYETRKQEVLFAFGHGLSYTTFKLSNVSVTGSEDALKVSVKVENIGKVDGSEG